MDNANNEIATTIANQLAHGTGRLSIMIGAHSFSTSGRDLTFKFKSPAKNGANCCRITLRGDDTYRVEFIRLRGVNFWAKGDFTDQYAEDLQPLFERETGLYLSL
jgi:hypothetical protein